MTAIKLHRPSPALVVAAIALFVVLGGTGYAATHTAATKSLTKAQVNKLIAKYVRSHKKQLLGPAGSPGANGGPGVTGAQGPGAVRVAATNSSSDASPAAAGTVGPWSITLKCAGGNSTMSVNGPGTTQGTTTLATGNLPGQTYVDGPGPIGAGANYVINTGGQMSQTLFLISGSTMYELQTVMTAVDGGLFTNCALVGDAIPVP